ncbi:MULTISPECIES: hypothetical protein [unclassified Sinorhizobium]|uniref:hypothetical protein n=1 Tax=Sinorhizobium/Ensifer group TaxID=227292 RepID=UPI00115FD076|nr:MULTISPECIES: hypothetical protein [unclassified Sinorhizobium]
MKHSSVFSAAKNSALLAFAVADIAGANLCRNGNRYPNGEKMCKKQPATIWHAGANKGRDRTSSTRTDGGKHECIDVDTPSWSSGPPFGLTGSATYLLKEIDALPGLRKTKPSFGLHFRTDLFIIRMRGNPAFLQNTLKEQCNVRLV